MDLFNEKDLKIRPLSHGRSRFSPRPALSHRRLGRHKAGIELSDIGPAQGRQAASPDFALCWNEKFKETIVIK